MTKGEEEETRVPNASEDGDGDGNGEVAGEENVTRETAEQSKALGSLTSQVEEKELDAAKAQSAAQGVEDLQQAVRAQREEAAQRERALAAVKISSSDVDILVREFDLPKAAAERALREAGGDAKAALSKLCCSTGAA